MFIAKLRIEYRVFIYPLPLYKHNLPNFQQLPPTRVGHLLQWMSPSGQAHMDVLSLEVLG